MKNSLMAAMTAPVEETETEEEIVISVVTPDDLTRIKGIAEAREQRLYLLGIYTFAQLVAADPEWLSGELGALVTPAMVQRWQAEASTFGE